MDDIEKFRRGADEAGELFLRFWAAFPVRRNEVTLRNRWESGDRNVVKVTGDDDGDRYELQFTKEQEQALIDAYKLARPDYDERMDGGSEARIFVGILESWGDSIQLFAERKPDKQKERERSIEKINVALLKLDEALSELDSGALGFWYAHIVDATAKSGHQLSATDSALVSMLNEPVRAIVEAGEFRQTLRHLIGAWVDSTKTAASILPKHDHQQHDQRFQMARGLERMVIEHQIPFDIAERGFPALCLRAVFDLGGLDVEKVSYWLKKAAEDPDSFAKFTERMRRKIEGENPPSL